MKTLFGTLKIGSSSGTLNKYEGSGIIRGWNNANYYLVLDNCGHIGKVAGRISPEEMTNYLA